MKTIQAMFRHYLARARLWLIDSELKASYFNERSAMGMNEPQLVAIERRYQAKLLTRRSQVERML